MSFDLVLQQLRRSIRPPRASRGRRLLVLGDWPERLQVAADAVDAARRVDAAPPGPFDLILWRPAAAVNPRLLQSVGERLAERGRLWICHRSGHRRQLVFDLGRAGYAVLEEHRFPELCLVETRRDGFITREYQPGDEDDILRLFAPAFHVRRSPEHWRWKYLQNPWGRTLITTSRTADGELAAHYAAYPVPFLDARRGSTLMALQIGDTMTDPRFRRAGRGVSSLLGRCFRHFFSRHCDDRIAFNYGFNTGNIRRFNFQFIKGRLARPVDYWRRGPEPPAGAGYRAIAVEDVDGEFDRLLRRVARHYGFLVRRDAAWLRWRYLDCPDAPPFRLIAARRGRKLVGWGVFRRRPAAGGDAGDRLLVVDALFDPRHAGAVADVLRAALDAEPGVTEVVGWMAPNPPWWRRAVEGLGFVEDREPNDLALIYLPFTHPEVETLLPAAYYAWGDGDLA
ncbi:MAG: GNAT family N-acetyltransferase [Acidobacteriota bacterium]